MKQLPVAYLNHPTRVRDTHDSNGKEYDGFAKIFAPVRIIPTTYDNMVPQLRTVFDTREEIKEFLKSLDNSKPAPPWDKDRLVNRDYIKYKFLAEKYWFKHIENGKRIIVNDAGGWCTELAGSVEIVDEIIVSTTNGRDLGIL